MSNKSYVLGIDLGTSNSALCALDLPSGEPHIRPLTQILAPSQMGGRPLLPSALYLPAENEFPAEALALPWEPADGQGVEPPVIVGEFARNHGALVPDRLVTSAKSWLSNPHTDPRSPVLPWGAEGDVPKVSAFDCARRYLAHMRAAFLSGEAEEGRERNPGDGQLVLTVPASFDEVARRLTADAAEAAGFEEVILLEEPQAAFYAWTEQAGSEWRQQVSAGDVVLVCDVGGGTCDFSLLVIQDADGNLAVERVSVGEHLLLGGDNMDLALAYTLQARIEENGQALDDWQFLALIQGASRAKVQLLSDPSLAEASVAVPSRGSSLFAKTISTKLTRDDLSAILLDGFFALTGVDEMPMEDGGDALREFGLPYEADAVISKHLARFLTRSLQNVRASENLRNLFANRPEVLEKSFLRPDAVLFNGGVFKAAPLRERVITLLENWSCGDAPRTLSGFEADLAVARGATVYGRNRLTGQGLRIKAGTARSYYIGLDSARPAVPGFKPPVSALCVVPQGMEEGTEHLLTGKTFGLVTGRPAVFRFFASEVRSDDAPGTLVPNAEKNLEETHKIEITLPPMEAFPPGQPIPVHLNSVVTELGNLELWMKHTASDQRWKVEFQVRME
jgi:molecular chaperone DnaK (HSP70)